MADDEIIVPPAWAVPPPPAASPVVPVANGQPDVITVPPGIADSATHKLPIERVRTPPPKPDVTFFSVAPGSPPPPPVAVAPPAPPAPSRPEPQLTDETVVVSRANRSWRLTVEGLPPVVVGGPLYIGRNPAALPPHDAAALLTIEDPRKSVSKTHALLELERNTLWLTDLHSTNGSAVLGADGAVTVLEAGVRTEVAAGSTIELGEFVIQVEHG